MSTHRTQQSSFATNCIDLERQLYEDIPVNLPQQKITREQKISAIYAVCISILAAAVSIWAYRK